jgi:hypothetical protein
MLQNKLPTDTDYSEDDSTDDVVDSSVTSSGRSPFGQTHCIGKKSPKNTDSVELPLDFINSLRVSKKVPLAMGTIKSVKHGNLIINIANFISFPSDCLEIKFRYITTEKGVHALVAMATKKSLYKTIKSKNKNKNKTFNELAKLCIKQSEKKSRIVRGQYLNVDYRTIKEKDKSIQLDYFSSTIVKNKPNTKCYKRENLGTKKNPKVYLVEKSLNNAMLAHTESLCQSGDYKGAIGLSNDTGSGSKLRASMIGISLKLLRKDAKAVMSDIEEAAGYINDNKIKIGRKKRYDDDMSDFYFDDDEDRDEDEDDKKSYISKSEMLEHVRDYETKLAKFDDVIGHALDAIKSLSKLKKELSGGNTRANREKIRKINKQIKEAKSIISMLKNSDVTRKPLRQMETYGMWPEALGTKRAVLNSEWKGKINASKLDKFEEHAEKKIESDLRKYEKKIRNVYKPAYRSKLGDRRPYKRQLRKAKAVEKRAKKLTKRYRKLDKKGKSYCGRTFWGGRLKNPDKCNEYLRNRGKMKRTYLKRLKRLENKHNSHKRVAGLFDAYRSGEAKGHINEHVDDGKVTFNDGSFESYRTSYSQRQRQNYGLNNMMMGQAGARGLGVQRYGYQNPMMMGQAGAQGFGVQRYGYQNPMMMGMQGAGMNYNSYMGNGMNVNYPRPQLYGGSQLMYGGGAAGGNGMNNNYNMTGGGPIQYYNHGSNSMPANSRPGGIYYQ